MATKTAQQTLVAITSPHFAKGYHLGRCWFFHNGGVVELPIDDIYLITNIASYCEKRLDREPEWLCERIGFIIGMVSGNVIPEE